MFYASMLAYADSGTGGTLGTLGKGGGVTLCLYYLPYVPYGDLSNLLGQAFRVLKNGNILGINRLYCYVEIVLSRVWD